MCPGLPDASPETAVRATGSLSTEVRAETRVGTEAGNEPRPLMGPSVLVETVTEKATRDHVLFLSAGVLRHT